MKYIGKNNTSLIIVCVFIGILICYFTMCNCRMNYGLIEGMDTGSTGSTGPKLSDMKDAMAAAAAAATGSKAKPKPTPEPSPPPAPTPPPIMISNTTAGTSSSTKNAAALATPTPVGSGKEGFEQQGRPLSYGPLQEVQDWSQDSTP